MMRIVIITIQIMMTMTMIWIVNIPMIMMTS